MVKFWTLYPTLQQKLNEVQHIILKNAAVSHQGVQDVLQEVVLTQGKMIRPALFFLFAQLEDTKKSPQEEARLLKIAASIEILHLATLVHDDIIDDSPLRRGKITLQAKYGKDVAVYAGDYLFTIFFELLVETMNGTPFLQKNAHAMKQILLGELGQMTDRFQLENSLESYLKNIQGKTSELFWLTCLEGAYFGGSNQEIQETASQIGRNIGLAFQIQDDILDYQSSSKELKKPVLEDLAQGVYTLPLLLAKEENPEAFTFLEEKKYQLTEEDALYAQELVDRYQGVEKAKDYVTNYIEKALQLIATLPHSKGQKQLEKVAKELIKRKF